MPAPDNAPPSTIVFEVDTARHVGAQLRYSGFGSGLHLADIRVAAQRLDDRNAPQPNEDQAQDPNVR